jgi:hypothetical protein
MDRIKNSIESLEKDLAEIDNLLKIATRNNIKRQLEQYKFSISDQLQSELRLLEQEKKQMLEKSEKTNEDSSLSFSTITKYAFDNTNDLFKFPK